MNGASAALTVSPLPFQGPLGAVRLADINGEFIVSDDDELEESDLDLIVSGSKGAILMIEGFARELPESLMAQAIAKAHEHIREICELQIELAQKVNVVKAVYPVPELIIQDQPSQADVHRTSPRPPRIAARTRPVAARRRLRSGRSGGPRLRLVRLRRS